MSIRYFVFEVWSLGWISVVFRWAMPSLYNYIIWAPVSFKFWCCDLRSKRAYWPELSFYLPLPTHPNYLLSKSTTFWTFSIFLRSWETSRDKPLKCLNELLILVKLLNKTCSNVWSCTTSSPSNWDDLDAKSCIICLKSKFSVMSPSRRLC